VEKFLIYVHNSPVKTAATSDDFTSKVIRVRFILRLSINTFH
jgi:hypothetical protein